MPKNVLFFLKKKKKKNCQVRQSVEAPPKAPLASGVGGSAPNPELIFSYIIASAS